MRLLSLFFSVVIFLGSLLPRFDFKELSQLDELFTHFQEHLKEAKGELSFSEFMAMHYANKNHDQQENHDHLPFHNHECQLGALMVLLPNLSCSCIVIPVIQAKQSFYKFVNYSRYTHSIWQPPKI
jgi:hypothetical protein